MRKLWEKCTAVVLGIISSVGMISRPGLATPPPAGHVKISRIGSNDPLYLEHHRQVEAQIEGTQTPPGTFAHRSHSSHRSHASHASHASHYSGTTYPTPDTSPTHYSSVAVNQPPTARSDEIITNEDTSKTFALRGSDPDGNTITYSIVQSPQHGQLSGTDPSRMSYAPSSDYNGQDSFTFKVSDGVYDSAPATVSIAIRPVNDAPIAEPQRVTTIKDTAKAITLDATDVDNKSLIYKIITQPKNGKIEGKRHDFVYTPKPGFSGSDSFSFKANDGTSDSKLAVVNITVRAENNPPVADSQSIIVLADQSSTIYLTAKDRDGDKLSFRVVEQPQHGSLQVSKGTRQVIYTPFQGYIGEDTFSFIADDGFADSEPGVISLEVSE